MTLPTRKAEGLAMWMIWDIGIGLLTPGTATRGRYPLAHVSCSFGLSCQPDQPVSVDTWMDASGLESQALGPIFQALI
jgi:hypothetical protein